jgi:peptide deformylase
VDEEIMINPVIVEKSQEIVTSEEACLSVPDVI